MLRAETIHRGTRVTLVAIGFFAGFLLMAGIYGLLFPQRLVDAGVGTVPNAYRLSVALLLTGAVGVLLRRYVTERVLHEEE